MRHIIIYVASFILLASVCFGQESAGYFEDGSKALLFEFSGLANLGAGSFDGGFGGKYFLNKKLAVRGSLQFTDRSESIPYNDTGGFDGKRKATRFGISAAVEFHFDTSRVNPYIGGGLGFGVISTEYKSAAPDWQSQETIKNDEDGEFGYRGGSEFTVFGLLGVEVFIIKNLSLAAEYRLGYTSASRKDEEVIRGNSTVTTKLGSTTDMGIESAGALILAVYF
jgi:hypothetical protein